MLSSPVVVGILASVIAGSSGYYLSFRFNGTNHAATDTSGDFGTPRGSFFALMSGCIIGMACISLAGNFSLIAKEAIGVGLIASMIVGMVAGMAGAFSGVNKRRSNNDQKK